MHPPPAIAVLPQAPRTKSPVPGLTSLYWKPWRGDYGDARYPGNCSGELIKDLLRYFDAQRVLDPMTGSGTCRDVCRELGIECRSTDLFTTLFDGADACDPKSFASIGTFDFIWLHPPYWRQKVYSDDSRDLSTAPTLDAFFDGYERLIDNCVDVLQPGGKLAILMGDYSDRDVGFVPLTYHTKRLAFSAGLKQCCTDIIRFSHGASSSKKTYRSSFIPGLHDVCSVFERSQKP
jgi:SAM-dependent methyltransferase